MRDVSIELLEIPDGVEYVIGIDNGLDGGAILFQVTDHLQLVEKFRFKTVARVDGKHFDSNAFRRWLIECPVGALPPSKTIAIVEEPLRMGKVRGGGKIGAEGGGTTTETTASTSVTYGRILSVLDVAEIEYITVMVQSWTSAHWGGKKAPWSELKGREKASITICQEIYPDFDWKLSDRAKRAHHDGFTDAALIGRFGALRWRSYPERREGAKKKKAAKRKAAREAAKKS